MKALVNFLRAFRDFFLHFDEIDAAFTEDELRK